MDVTVNFTPLPLYCRKKGSLFSLNIDLSGSRILFGQFAEQKRFCPSREENHVAHILLALPIKLARVHI